MRCFTAFLLVCVAACAEEPSVWTRHQVDGGGVHSIQVDPSDASHVLAMGGPVQYMSGDGGRTWQPVRPPATPEGGTAHLLAGGALWKGVGSSLYRSGDLSKTWSLEKDFKPLALQAISPCGREAKDVLAVLCAEGSSGRREWYSARTSDGWNPNPMPTPVSDPGQPDMVMVLLSSAANDPNRHAASFSAIGSKKGDMFFTRDGGKEWSRIDLPGKVNEFGFDPRDPHVMFAAFFTTEGEYGELLRSDDEGKTWRPFPTAPQGVGISAIAIPSKGPRIYLGTSDRGVLAVDGGEVRESNHGLHNLRCNCLAVLDGSELLAGTGHGLFRSTDQGESWTPSDAGMSNLDACGVTFDASGWMALCDREYGVRTSADGGCTWSPIEAAFPFDGAQELHGSRSSMIALAHGELWSSRDGKGWERGNKMPTEVETCAWVSASEMYSVLDKGPVYSSKDGRTWEPTGGKVDVRAIAGHGLLARPGLLVAYGAKGLARSTDGGKTWDQKTHAKPLLCCYEAALSRDWVLVCDMGKVLRYDWAKDQSSTYYDSGSEDDWVSGLWCSPVDPLRGLVALMPDRLMYTADGGKTWTNLYDGLPPNAFPGPFVSPDGRVFVGCAGTLYSRALPK